MEFKATSAKVEVGVEVEAELGNFDPPLSPPILRKKSIIRKGGRTLCIHLFS